MQCSRVASNVNQSTCGMPFAAGGSFWHVWVCVLFPTEVLSFFDGSWRSMYAVHLFLDHQMHVEVKILRVLIVVGVPT